MTEAVPIFLSWTSVAPSGESRKRSAGSEHGLLGRDCSCASKYREPCLVQGMDDQLLAGVEQLTGSGLAPEMCILRLLPLLTSRQNGEHIQSASPDSAGLGCPGHCTFTQFGAPICKASLSTQKEFHAHNKLLLCSRILQ